MLLRVRFLVRSTPSSINVTADLFENTCKVRHHSNEACHWSLRWWLLVRIWICFSFFLPSGSRSWLLLLHLGLLLLMYHCRPRYLLKLYPFGETKSLYPDTSLATRSLHVHLMLVDVHPDIHSFARAHLHLCFEPYLVPVSFLTVERECLDDISDLNIINSW
jgi:hypothetical protein